MILKEAFRHQNFLSDIMESAISHLNYTDNIVTKKQEHMKHAANPDASDETIIVPKQVDFKYSSMDVVDFLMDVLKEKEILTDAITNAKSKSDVDIDSSIAMNKVRQTLASVFERMASLKSSEKETSAYGYKFNINGEQVKYAYNVKETTTIDFDRNDVKSLSRKLRKKSDEVSDAIDRINVTLEVDYTPKYEIGDSLEDCIAVFKLKN